MSDPTRGSWTLDLCNGAPGRIRTPDPLIRSHEVKGITICIFNKIKALYSLKYGYYLLCYIKFETVSNGN